LLLIVNLSTFPDIGSPRRIGSALSLFAVFGCGGFGRGANIFCASLFEDVLGQGYFIGIFGVNRDQNIALPNLALVVNDVKLKGIRSYYGYGYTYGGSYGYDYSMGYGYANGHGKKKTTWRKLFRTRR